MRKPPEFLQADRINKHQPTDHKSFCRSVVYALIFLLFIMGSVASIVLYILGNTSAGQLYKLSITTVIFALFQPATEDSFLTLLLQLVPTFLCFLAIILIILIFAKYHSLRCVWRVSNCKPYGPC